MIPLKLGILYACSNSPLLREGGDLGMRLVPKIKFFDIINVEGAVWYKFSGNIVYTLRLPFSSPHFRIIVDIMFNLTCYSPCPQLALSENG